MPNDRRTVDDILTEWTVESSLDEAKTSLVISSDANEPMQQAELLDEDTHQTITIDGHPVQVEVLTDPAEQERGFRGRLEPAGNHGLLFIYPDAQPRHFTMTGVDFPLSLAFVENSRITQIIEMESNEDGPFSSTAPTSAALEMPADWFIKNGVDIGATVAGLPVKEATAISLFEASYSEFNKKCHEYFRHYTEKYWSAHKDQFPEPKYTMQGRSREGGIYWPLANTILINADLGGDDAAFKSVFVHEMIHYYDAMLHGQRMDKEAKSHGTYFNKMKDEINHSEGKDFIKQFWLVDQMGAAVKPFYVYIVDTGRDTYAIFWASERSDDIIARHLKAVYMNVKGGNVLIARSIDDAVAYVAQTTSGVLHRGTRLTAKSKTAYELVGPEDAVEYEAIKSLTTPENAVNPFKVQASETEPYFLYLMSDAPPIESTTTVIYFWSSKRNEKLYPFFAKARDYFYTITKIREPHAWVIPMESKLPIRGLSSIVSTSVKPKIGGNVRRATMAEYQPLLDAIKFLTPSNEINLKATKEEAEAKESTETYVYLLSKNAGADIIGFQTTKADNSAVENVARFYEYDQIYRLNEPTGLMQTRLPINKKISSGFKYMDLSKGGVMTSLLAADAKTQAAINSNNLIKSLDRAANESKINLDESTLTQLLNRSLATIRKATKQAFDEADTLVANDECEQMARNFAFWSGSSSIRFSKVINEVATENEEAVGRIVKRVFQSRDESLWDNRKVAETIKQLIQRHGIKQPKGGVRVTSKKGEDLENYLRGFFMLGESQCVFGNITDLPRKLSSLASGRVSHPNEVSQSEVASGLIRLKKEYEKELLGLEQRLQRLDQFVAELAQTLQSDFPAQPASNEPAWSDAADISVGRFTIINTASAWSIHNQILAKALQEATRLLHEIKLDFLCYGHVTVVPEVISVTHGSAVAVYKYKSDELSVSFKQHLLGNVDPAAAPGVRWFDDFVRSVIHELGHRLYFKSLSPTQRALQDDLYNQAKTNGSFVTDYAKGDALEDFADSFAFYVTKPSYRRDPSTERLRTVLTNARLLRESFHDVGFVGKRWGRAGSGMLLTTGSSFLLLKRSRSVEQPGTWGIPGGAIPEEDDRPMDVLVSANKEAVEEIGPLPPHRIINKYVFRDNDFTFTTFIARVEQEFKPVLNWESDDHAWTSRDDLKKYRLHPGVVELLKHVDPFDTKLSEGTEIAVDGKLNDPAVERGIQYIKIEMSKPGHLYRGMEEAEYKNTVGAGKPIKSTGRYSDPSEGTCFSEEGADALSYVNFGRSDPRKTGKPNYVVEVKKIPSIVLDKRDYYWKAQEPVQLSYVTRVWRIDGRDGRNTITLLDNSLREDTELLTEARLVDFHKQVISSLRLFFTNLADRVRDDIKRNGKMSDELRDIIFPSSLSSPGVAEHEKLEGTVSDLIYSYRKTVRTIIEKVFAVRGFGSTVPFSERLDDIHKIFTVAASGKENAVEVPIKLIGRTHRKGEKLQDYATELIMGAFAANAEFRRKEQGGDGKDYNSFYLGSALVRCFGDFRLTGGYGLSNPKEYVDLSIGQRLSALDEIEKNGLAMIKVIDQNLDRVERYFDKLARAQEAMRSNPQRGGEKSLITDVESISVGPFTVINKATSWNYEYQALAFVLQRAQELLKRDGFGYLCYGDVTLVNKLEVNPKADNKITYAHYRIDKDDVEFAFQEMGLESMLQRPKGFQDSDESGLAYAITATIHELGHRLYAKKLTAGQRKRFTSLYREAKDNGGVFVSKYAKADEWEDFAEQFEEYIRHPSSRRGPWTERLRTILKDARLLKEDALDEDTSAGLRHRLISGLRDQIEADYLAPARQSIKEHGRLTDDTLKQLEDLGTRNRLVVSTQEIKTRFDDLLREYEKRVLMSRGPSEIGFADPELLRKLLVQYKISAPAKMAGAKFTGARGFYEYLRLALDNLPTSSLKFIPEMIARDDVLSSQVYHTDEERRARFKETEARIGRLIDSLDKNLVRIERFAKEIIEALEKWNKETGNGIGNQPTDVGEVTVGRFTVINRFSVEQSDLDFTATVLQESERRLKALGFSRLCYGPVVLYRELGNIAKDNNKPAYANYDPKKDIIRVAAHYVLGSAPAAAHIARNPNFSLIKKAVPLMIHELGHRLHLRILDAGDRAFFKNLFDEAKAKGYLFVSSYAETDEGEDFAEQFSFYVDSAVARARDNAYTQRLQAVLRRARLIQETTEVPSGPTVDDLLEGRGNLTIDEAKARLVYHGTTAEKAEKILASGLDLNAPVSTHNFKNRVSFCTNTPEAARNYGPAIVVLKVRSGAKTKIIKPQQLFIKGMNLMDSIETWIPKWREQDLDLIYVTDWQSTVGNIVLNPKVLEPIKIFNDDLAENLGTTQLLEASTELKAEVVRLFNEVSHKYFPHVTSTPSPSIVIRANLPGSRLASYAPPPRNTISIDADAATVSPDLLKSLVWHEAIHYYEWFDWLGDRDDRTKNKLWTMSSRFDGGHEVYFKQQMERINRTEGRELIVVHNPEIDIKAAKPFGLYVFSVPGWHDRYGICWSADYDPEIAKKLKAGFERGRTPGSVKVWAGSFNDAYLKKTGKRLTSGGISGRKWPAVDSTDDVFRRIAEFVRPENLIEATTADEFDAQALTWIEKHAPEEIENIYRLHLV